MLTKHDHWAMDTDEASALSGAIANVAQHYPKIAASQKIVDWVMLLQVGVFMYGPRFYASARMRKPANVRAPEKQPDPTSQGFTGNGATLHDFGGMAQAG